MALILNIDTSTSICSVALADSGEITTIKESNKGLNHSFCWELSSMKFCAKNNSMYINWMLLPSAWGLALTQAYASVYLWPKACVLGPENP